MPLRSATLDTFPPTPTHSDALVKHSKTYRFSPLRKWNANAPRGYHWGVRIFDLLPLGLTDYTEVDQLQRKLHTDVLEGGEDALILGEFTPTYTAGRHTKDHHIPDSSLPVIPVDRAGSVTWHGPGQLVCYPVVKLSGDPVDTVAWIRAVENGVLTTLQEEWNLDVCRIDGRAGVWLRTPGTPDRKICAIGLKVARGATLHGIALNVHIDFDSAFTGIIPCGLDDADVASLSTEGITTSVPAAADALVGHMLTSIARCLARPIESVHTVDSDTLTHFFGGNE